VVSAVDPSRACHSSPAPNQAPRCSPAQLNNDTAHMNRPKAGCNWLQTGKPYASRKSDNSGALGLCPPGAHYCPPSDKCCITQV